jgi:hypothetical protein
MYRIMQRTTPVVLDNSSTLHNHERRQETKVHGDTCGRCCGPPVADARRMNCLAKDINGGEGE